MKDYSNYHGISTNEKLSHDGLLLLQKSLDGFEGNDVTINSEFQSKVLIHQKWDANTETKKVIGHIADIELGNLLKIDNYNWLITTFPEDNKIYRKAEIRLCNATFPIESNKTSVLKGYDKYNRPVYADEITIIDEPCIVETKYYFNNRNEQITLPEDRILITMKYQSASNIDISKEFEMYKSRFKITHFDFSKVINGKGVMVFTGERVMDK
jgi:hypothetical protein